MKKRKLLIAIVALMVIAMLGLSAQCGFGGEAPTLELRSMMVQIIQSLTVCATTV